jgi:putative redox protein
MATVTVKHEDGMRSSINVRGHRVVVDVPAHVGGGDRGMAPPDLLAGSLGACLALCIARWCRAEGVPCDGFRVQIDYAQGREDQCVPLLSIRVTMPDCFPDRRRAALIVEAEQCAVHNALCPLPQIDIAVGRPPAIV